MELLRNLDNLQNVGETLDEKKEIDISVNDSLSTNNFKNYDNEVAINSSIDDLMKNLEKNIEDQIDKINVDSTFWEKISKGKFKDIIQNGVETALKTLLKKKFKIGYNTFNDFKDGVSAVMDGNLKESIKKGTDIAVDALPLGDATIKSAIKGVKNNVLDKVISTEKYDIVNRQTKVLEKVNKHCKEFDEAFKGQDKELIQRKASAIRKDMKSLLPIRETINNAQNALDRYELWKNKGEKALTEEEENLINALNKSA